MSNLSQLVREKTIPVEIGSVWFWVKTFDSSWLPDFTAYSSIELLNKSKVSREPFQPVGLLREVVVQSESGEYQIKERLEYFDESTFTLIYSLQSYKGPENSSKKAEDKLPLTLFTFKLKPGLNEFDRSPETTLIWVCQYSESDSVIKDILEPVLIRGIDSCFKSLEDKHEGVIGQCTVMLKQARNLAKADLMSSDPYCWIKLADMEPHEALRSNTKMFTVNPDYNQEFKLVMRPKSFNISFTFYDFDSIKMGDEDDYLGCAEMEFADLEDGVAKEMTLDLNTQGKVTFTIKLDIEEGCKIPLTLKERKRRALVNRKGNHKLEGNEIGSQDEDPKLQTFAMKKFLGDTGQVLTEEQVELIVDSFLYVKSYLDEIDEEDLKTAESAHHNNTTVMRKNTSAALKQLFTKIAVAETNKH